MEEVAGDLFLFRHEKFVVLIIDQQHFAFPYLVHLAGDDLSLLLLELIEYGILLEVENLRLECLPQIENGAAAELLEEDLLGHILSNFAFGVNVAGIGQADLAVGVGHGAVLHDFKVLIYIAVPFVGVHDDVEVLVCAKHLGQHVAE